MKNNPIQEAADILAYEKDFQEAFNAARKNKRSKTDEKKIESVKDLLTYGSKGVNPYDLSIQDAATYIGVTPKTVYNWINDEKMPTKENGRVSLDNMLKWIINREREKSKEKDNALIKKERAAVIKIKEVEGELKAHKLKEQTGKMMLISEVDKMRQKIIVAFSNLMDDLIDRLADADGTPAERREIGRRHANNVRMRLNPEYEDI